MRQTLPRIAMLLLATLIWMEVPAHAQEGTAAGPWQTYDTSNGEWRSYAGDIGGRKYSPLEQIDASNFADLELAWEWTSVDNRVSRTTPGGGEWWAPLDTVVEALVEETPDLYRTGHLPSPTGFPGHAVDGRRGPLLQHPAVAGRRRRRPDRRNAVGVQPEELRRGHDDDDRGRGASGAWRTGPTARATSASSGVPATATWSASRRRPGSRAPTSAPTAAAWSTRWSASRAPPAASATT